MEVKYIVNREERKVVCVITENRHRLSEILSGLDDGTNLLWDVPCDLKWIKSTHVGIATCSPEDEWNEEFGRKLAFDRAKTKLDRAVFSAAAKSINYLDRQIDKIMDMINAYGEKLANNADHRRKVIHDMAAEMFGEE